MSFFEKLKQGLTRTKEAITGKDAFLKLDNDPSNISFFISNPTYKKNIAIIKSFMIICKLKLPIRFVWWNILIYISLKLLFAINIDIAVAQIRSRPGKHLWFCDIFYFVNHKIAPHISFRI